jgi:hypothetical protein
VRFIGGIGGEGATAIKLPAGYAYRVPKGFALMANVHYVNVSPGPIQGQGVVDVQLRKPDGTSKTADIMTNLDTTLNVPARKACTEDAQCGEAKCDKAAKLCDTKFALDVSCKFEKEMTAVMWSNHVHEWGTKVSSKLVRADGTEELLSADDPWEKEMTYNPRFRTYPAEAPLVFRPGDTVTTHCEWNNDTGGDLPFGPEMCVGIAFYVTTPELTGMQVCDKGAWSVQ